jgi:hypothetical protein
MGVPEWWQLRWPVCCQAADQGARIACVALDMCHLFVQSTTVQGSGWVGGRLGMPAGMQQASQAQRTCWCWGWLWGLWGPHPTGGCGGWPRERLPAQCQMAQVLQAA